jgi:hypothetical protein
MKITATVNGDVVTVEGECQPGLESRLYRAKEVVRNSLLAETPRAEELKQKISDLIDGIIDNDCIVDGGDLEDLKKNLVELKKFLGRDHPEIAHFMGLLAFLDIDV